VSGYARVWCSNVFRYYFYIKDAERGLCDLTGAFTPSMWETYSNEEYMKRFTMNYERR